MYHEKKRKKLNNKQDGTVSRISSPLNLKGTGHFFETPSAASAPGTDHSQIHAFPINNRFQAEKRIYMPVPA